MTVHQHDGPQDHVEKSEGKQTGFLYATAQNAGTPSNSLQSSDHGDVAYAEKGIAVSDNAPSPRNVHGIRWAVAVLSVLASTFLFALDNTIVADVPLWIVLEKSTNYPGFQWPS
jgi:hypothetical protein